MMAIPSSAQTMLQGQDRNIVERVDLGGQQTQLEQLTAQTARTTATDTSAAIATGPNVPIE